MLLNAYERSDLGQSRFIHSRLEELLAKAEQELSVLRESRGKKSLRRKAVRRQKEITRALAWSKKLMEGKRTPTLSWGDADRSLDGAC